MATTPPIGSQDDMSARLLAALPSHWFAETAPVLESTLSGFASAASWIYGQIQAVRSQSRIATASATYLDLIALDFFGARIVRRNAEADDSFRSRVQRELLRERATRAAVVSVVTDLTGAAPWIFEPSRPADTGSYGMACGYNAAGGWGSLSMPFQALISVQRPKGLGVSLVAGYGSTAAGYGTGPIAYAALDQVQSQVSDADIYQAVAGVMPSSCIAWTAIHS